MYDRTQGPWHEGYAVTCEVLGSYVTIVAGNPDVAEAIARLAASSFVSPPTPAMVGRLKTPVAELTKERRRIR